MIRHPIDIPFLKTIDLEGECEAIPGDSVLGENLEGGQRAGVSVVWEKLKQKNIILLQFAYLYYFGMHIRIIASLGCLWEN